MRRKFGATAWLTLLLLLFGCGSDGVATEPTSTFDPRKVVADSTPARCANTTSSLAAQYIDSQDTQFVTDEWGYQSPVSQEIFQWFGPVQLTRLREGIAAAAHKLTDLSVAACSRASFANAALHLNPGDDGYLSIDLPTPAS